MSWSVRGKQRNQPFDFFLSLLVLEQWCTGGKSHELRFTMDGDTSLAEWSLQSLRTICSELLDEASNLRSGWCY